MQGPQEIGTANVISPLRVRTGIAVFVAHAAEIDDPVKHMDVRESLGLRVGGFGILMTKGLVDEMDYNQAGNEVRLVKYFDGKPGDARAEP